MAISGSRNCALASSKFSLRTMRTYSGENRTLLFPQTDQVGQQPIGAGDAGRQLPPQAKTGVEPASLSDPGLDQDAGLRSGVVRKRIGGAQQIDVLGVALAHEIRAALL